MKIRKGAWNREYTSFAVDLVDDVLSLQGLLRVPNVDGLWQELLVES